MSLQFHLLEWLQHVLSPLPDVSLCWTRSGLVFIDIDKVDRTFPARKVCHYSSTFWSGFSMCCPHYQMCPCVRLGRALSLLILTRSTEHFLHGKFVITVPPSGVIAACADLTLPGWLLFDEIWVMLTRTVPTFVWSDRSMRCPHKPVVVSVLGWLMFPRYL